MDGITAFSAFDFGNRERMEDFAADEIVNTAGGLNLQLAMVCDGVGGKGGELAARLTARTVIDAIQISEEQEIPRLLMMAVETTNDAVFKELGGTGTSTLALMAIDLDEAPYGRLFIASVGDSRIYLMRDGQLARLNTDHTLSNEYVIAGQMTPEEAVQLQNGDQMLRIIGLNNTVNVDIGFYAQRGKDFVGAKHAFNLGVQGLKLQEGDTLVAGSDGLFMEDPNADEPGTPYLRKEEMLRHALDNDVQRATQNMLRYAGERHPDDNIAMSTVFVPSAQRRAVRLGGLSRRQRIMLSLLISGLVFGLIVAGLFAGNSVLRTNALDSTQAAINVILTNRAIVTDTPTPTPTITPSPTPAPTLRPTPVSPDQVGFFWLNNNPAPDPVFDRSSYTWSDVSYLAIEGIAGIQGVRPIRQASVFMQPNTIIQLERVLDIEGGERVEMGLSGGGDVFVNSGSFTVGGVQVSMMQQSETLMNGFVECLAAKRIPPDPNANRENETVALSCYTGLDGDCAYEFAPGAVTPMPAGRRVVLDLASKEQIGTPGPILFDEARLYYDTIDELVENVDDFVCLRPFLDSDGDSVPYPQDQCEGELGSPATNGCADADLDGIRDTEDDCPLEPGVLQLNGCPLPTLTPEPDSDGDGVPDVDDACRDEPGIPELSGCPVGEGTFVATFTRTPTTVPTEGVTAVALITLAPAGDTDDETPASEPIDSGGTPVGVVTTPTPTDALVEPSNTPAVTEVDPSPNTPAPIATVVPTATPTLIVPTATSGPVLETAVSTNTPDPNLATDTNTPDPSITPTITRTPSRTNTPTPRPTSTLIGVTPSTLTPTGEVLLSPTPTPTGIIIDVPTVEIPSVTPFTETPQVSTPTFTPTPLTATQTFEAIVSATAFAESLTLTAEAPQEDEGDPVEVDGVLSFPDIQTETPRPGAPGIDPTLTPSITPTPVIVPTDVLPTLSKPTPVPTNPPGKHTLDDEDVGETGSRPLLTPSFTPFMQTSEP